jgi:hypothetical protein
MTAITPYDQQAVSHYVMKREEFFALINGAKQPVLLNVGRHAFATAPGAPYPVPTLCVQYAQPQFPPTVVADINTPVRTAQAMTPLRAAPRHLPVTSAGLNPMPIAPPVINAARPVPLPDSPQIPLPAVVPPPPPPAASPVPLPAEPSTLVLKKGEQSHVMTFGQLYRLHRVRLGPENEQVTVLYSRFKLPSGVAVYELWDTWVRPGKVALRCVNCHKATVVTSGPLSTADRYLHFSLENRWAWGSCGNQLCDTIAEHLFDPVMYTEDPELNRLGEGLQAEIYTASTEQNAVLMEE